MPSTLGSAPPLTPLSSSPARPLSSIAQVYKLNCKVVSERTDCQFQDPLQMNPRNAPSFLRCLKSEYAVDGDRSTGSCFLGPNRHGDACNNDAECASGTCSKRLRMCTGVEGGQSCVVSSPDPCAPGFFCSISGQCTAQFAAPAPGAAATRCTNPMSCARGLFCAGGAADGDSYCLPAYSVATGSNTTLGPYMCATGNAYMVVQGATSASSMFQCIAPPPALGGTRDADAPLCASNPKMVPGQTCQCASDGNLRVTTVGGVGLGARAAVWAELYQCLQNSRGVTGDPCQFDVTDMEKIRYGSCAYYSCFPSYVKLATITGARFLDPPLSYFDSSAPCEKTAARNFYASTAGASCISIEGIDNWTCFLGPRSLSVAATNGVIAVIFIIVWGGYLYHMWYFRKENQIVFPCKRLND
jgi:hypothetical protein